MFKHILIPTDGSALSRRAIAVGVKLAKTLGARVTGVFAAPPATPLLYGNNLPVRYGTTGAHAKLIERTAAKHLAHIERAADKAGVRYAGVTVTSDFPADVILAVAKKRKCGLIVMGSRGQGGLKGALLGSTAQKVLTRSKIPVMVCR